MTQPTEQQCNCHNYVRGTIRWTCPVHGELWPEQITTERDWAMQRAADALVDVLWVSASEQQAALIAVAAALREARAEGWNAAADALAEPYSTRIFAELSVDELAKASWALQQMQRGLCDRLHAGWARHWADVLRRRTAEEQDDE